MVAWRFVIDVNGCVKVTVKTNIKLNKKILRKEEKKKSVYHHSLWPLWWY